MPSTSSVHDTGVEPIATRPGRGLSVGARTAGATEAEVAGMATQSCPDATGAALVPASGISTWLAAGGTFGGSVGCVVGALFGGFSFAISAFAVPMLLDRRVDALTAMGTSLALVWNNLPLMLTWGAIMLGLIALSVATGFLGLIVAFPVLGHGTWHAYESIKP